MVKPSMKRAAGPKKPTKPRSAATVDPAAPSGHEVEPASAPQGSLETLKDNLKHIEKGKMAGALKRVKEMKSDSWKDPSAVRKLTEGIAQDIGIRVDPRRMDAFMNAFNEIAKNAGDKGPSVSVDDIAKKYGGDLDDKTIKEIKKFVK